MVRQNAALPDTPEGLAEWLAGRDNPLGAEFHRAYAAAFARRDGGEVAGQLLEQRPAGLAGAGGARDALYLPQAPGAKVRPGTSSIGEFFAAARGRGPAAVRASLVRNAYGGEVPADGGFLVPEEWRSDIVLASLESAIMRPRAMVLPMRQLRTNVPVVDDTTHATTVLGGVNFVWTEENTPLTESQGTFGLVTLDAKKVAGYLTAPNELVADGPAFSAFIRRVMPLGLAWAEDDAFISGTGVGKPLGCLNAPCAIKVTRGTSSKVLHADVISMVTRILPQSLNRYVWLCSTDVFVQLLQVYLLVGTIPTSAAAAPPGWLAPDPSGQWRLLGAPIYATEHSPAMGTLGDLAAVDPAMYVIGDLVVSQLDASDQLQYNLDKSVFRLTARCDGRMWPQTAVTPKRGANTVSPVVLLN